MGKDFEFRQLLRAYRAGLITEETFETEMAMLDAQNGGSGQPRGFQAFGKTYNSERDAIVSFLDKVQAAESNAGAAFSDWAKVCTTDCIRSGIKMIAERENYHGRIFSQRIRELGAEPRATVSEESKQFAACAADPAMSDGDKLMRVATSFANPEAVIQPIIDFANLINEDQETKEALRLFAEDELSSTRWLVYACGALNAPAEQASANQQ
ncbi:MAG TPA: hypothetical protein VMF50_00025 [Candidatus Binataceae bacterium]|nr:hypothetical protein [Candidatus Binataceae bacterium]